MLQKKYLVASLILHLLLCYFLVFGLPYKKTAKDHVAISAQLMFKKKARPENWLPEKMPPQAKKIVAEEKAPTKQPKETAALPIKKDLKPKKTADYMRELARLSKSFSEELDHNVDAKEVIEEVEADGSYFDQIYSLIKRSFVVPPHVNGPRGRSLQAVLRLFISPKGDLFRVTLVRSSGDEHFDKAVMDGTKRVHNFGAVPLMLQNSLREDGVLVEMCPFKCSERRGG
ncbi:MAG TPA: TonB C-terminal domain-containing protein [Myxococcota bacterium]|nr:TonB C-terminal domain-containing protein [Myxococcota bacterium]